MRIDWKRERRRILLPVQVLAPYPVTDLTGLDGTALIDTGSSVSGVALALAAELNLNPLGKRPLVSAQGESQVERYAFRIGLRPDSSLEPTFPYVFDEVIGLELINSFQFNVLIGMDILGQCDISMARNGDCSLAFGP